MMGRGRPDTFLRLHHKMVPPKRMNYFLSFSKTVDARPVAEAPTPSFQKQDAFTVSS